MMNKPCPDFPTGPDTAPSPERRRARQAGFGLIDSMISLVVISVSTVGYLSASVTSMSLEKESRTVAAANEMSRAVVEQMLAIPIQQVLPSYNASKADDPSGAGTARGSAWTIDTTAVLLATDDATASTTTRGTGLVGQVVGTTQQTTQTTQTTTSARVAAAEALEVPKSMDCAIQLPTTRDAAGNEVLREDSVNPELGLPCDLNGDGKIDSLNHAADYKVLPLMIRLSWPTPDGGTRTMTFATVIGGGKS